jgi:hypothetical protein
VSAPFRDAETAHEARAQQLEEEVLELRARVAAYDGENRDAVMAGQLARLRADIEVAKAERERLRAELQSLGALPPRGQPGRPRDE